MDHVNISDLAAATPPFLYLPALSGLHYIAEFDVSIEDILEQIKSNEI